jgi:hypothetical protein
MIFEGREKTPPGGETPGGAEGDQETSFRRVTPASAAASVAPP